MPTPITAGDVYLTPEERRELLIAAPNHQGGHSESGMDIAEKLGIAFPITMENLEANAAKHGFDWTLLWPWLVTLRTKTPIAPDVRTG